MVLAYAALGALGLSNHSMWRDEMNTWLLIRDTGSLSDLFALVRYQGHAPLWALLNSAAFWLDPSPSSMKVLNWLICVSAMSVFWARAPFPLYQKVLFTFGYVPFFEFFLISRPYSLLLLFTMLYCAVHDARRFSYLPGAVVLGLLANTHAYGLIAAVVLGVLLVHEALRDPERRAALREPVRRADAAAALAVFALALGIVVYILLPPADSTNAGGRAALLAFDHSLYDILHRLGRLLGSFTLIEPARRWPDTIAGVVAGLALFGLFAWRLRDSRFGFWLFVAANLVIWFGNIRHGGGIVSRHFAFTFVLLVAALWLCQRDTGRSLRLSQARGAGERVFALAFAGCLLMHLGGGVVRYAMLLHTPYSASHPTAAFLADPRFDDALLFGTPAPSMAAISGYLNRRIHYPETGREGSYFIFDGTYTPLQGPTAFVPALRAVLDTAAPGQEVVLIVTLDLTSRAFDPLGMTFTEIGRFNRAYLNSERFYLYSVSR